MQEKQLLTERGTVYYWIDRSSNTNAKTLVFLHGLTADHTLFDRQMQFFSGRYNLIVWDAPAHGKSRPYSNFSYPNAAFDLKRILDENEIHSAVMIGQSMGGYVIQSFLARYPDRAEAFIGIDTCPYGTGYYSNADRWWLRQVEWMSRLYPKSILKMAIAKQCTHTNAAFLNMMQALKPYGKRELSHLMGIGFSGFLEDNQDLKIRCPVCILVGEHDRTGKVLQYCRSWAEKTGYALIMIPGAAHNSNVDQPDAVDRAIEEFLKAL